MKNALVLLSVLAGLAAGPNVGNGHSSDGWQPAPGLRDQQDEESPLKLLVESIGRTNDPGIQAALLKGMLAGLEGRRQVDRPPGWSELSRQLSVSPDPRVRQQSMALSRIFGDREAIQRALQTIGDASEDATLRRSALRALLQQQNREAANMLATLLDEPELALDAIRGYAIVEHPDAPGILLQRYPRLEPPLQRAVVETLATRKAYAGKLQQALAHDQISKQEIPVPVARSLFELLGDSFTDLYGPVKTVAADRQRQLDKYRKLATPEAIAQADAVQGRAVFQKTCAACHQLYGTGGKVGPDLTGSNRANLDYILLNSVDPNFDVPDAYRTVMIQTLDGRLVSGVLAEEDDQKIVLKTAEQPRVVIAKEDIDARKLDGKSVMPEGQLDQMESQEVLDLIKYLRTTQQVELPQ